MNKSIFEFKSYKTYLKYFESQRPKKGRGFRSELARITGCQTAYISQIFNGSAHFSLEQAQSINLSLFHGKGESRFFILLVEYERAGTPALKEHFLELMEELVRAQHDLKKRFKVKDILSKENQHIYYSDWVYSAVHIAVTITALTSAEALADYYRIPLPKMREVIEFLHAAGLITLAKDGSYTVGTTRLHLGKDSPNLAKHHMNWRLQAMNSLSRNLKEDLHYTSVISVSVEDIEKIKTRFVNEIEKYNAIVKDSPEEAMQCLTLDFFSLS